MSPVTWKHEDLQHDLATTRRAVGEIAVERLAIGFYGGNGQIDVFAVRPSWMQPVPTVYEVKISRADFLRDTQAGKYQRYVPYCQRLYFATPEGMVHRKEVPEGMGLCVRGVNGWRTVHAPRMRAKPEGWSEILFSLLLKIHPGPWDPPTRAQRIEATARALETKWAGAGVAPRVAEALRETERLRGEVESARHYLCEALGVNPGEDARSLYSLAAALKEEAPVQAAPGMGQVRGALDAIRRQVERAERLISATEGEESHDA